MKKYMCAVRDTAADAFMAPFCVPNTALAVRSFRDEVNRSDTGNMMNQHPEDFELYVIGEYEEDHGVVNAIEKQLLIRGKDCVSLSN